MGLGAEFLRVVGRLGALSNLARLFPEVRRAPGKSVDEVLPANADEVLAPRVERSLGPIFHRARMELAPRLGMLTFAILHRTWEAQRLFLEAVAGELDAAATKRHPRREK